MMSYEIP